MKAIAYYRYGSLDVLKFENFPQLEARDDGDLIKAHAALLNSYDLNLLTGAPLWPVYGDFFATCPSPYRPPQR
jgi:NADPH:quinone reductase-like Zn-dependent oxidoreductase